MDKIVGMPGRNPLEVDTETDAEAVEVCIALESTLLLLALLRWKVL